MHDSLTSISPDNEMEIANSNSKTDINKTKAVKRDRHIASGVFLHC